MRWSSVHKSRLAGFGVAGRGILCLLLLGIVSTGPTLGASKNSGGAMLVHTDDAHSWTDGVCDHFDAWVGDDYTTLNTRTDKDESTSALIWFIAAFHPSANPEVMVVYFGNDHNLPAGYHNRYGFCGQPGAFDVPDPGWPDAPATAGNSIAFPSPVGDRLFPFYYFDVWGFDGAYYGTAANPVGGYASFVDDLNPPFEDRIDNFGQVRWHEDGYNDFPEPPTLGACCFEDGSCQYLLEPECWGSGGSYGGDLIECDPNPCGACCYWYRTFYDYEYYRKCVVTTEESCQYEGLGWHGAGYNHHKVDVGGEPLGSEWSYVGTTCADYQWEAPEKWWCFDPRYGNPIAACCAPDGACSTIHWSECREMEDGQFWGYGTDCSPNPCPQLEMEFIRGDANADNVLNTQDLLYYMAAIQMPDPTCWEAADSDDDGDADLSDAIRLLQYLFDQGSPPPPPFPGCGFDPTQDDLGCVVFPPCEPGGIEPPSDSAAVGGSGANAIRLRSIASLEGGRLIVPIELATNQNLLAFEFAVAFDPAILSFVGLNKSGSAGEGLGFFSARLEDATGRIYVGGVPDLSGETPLPSGRIELGQLVFRILDADHLEGNQVDATRVLFIAGDLTVLHASGEGMSTSSVDIRDADVLLADTRLSMPNPLRPSSAISFDLPQGAFVSMAIYNVGGQQVRDLAGAMFPSGHHELVWDGRTDAGQEVGPGIYYLRALLGSRRVNRTIALVR